MGSLQAYMRGVMLGIAEKKEAVLQEAIEHKLCTNGRIVQGEHLATIAYDYGTEEYFYQTGKEGRK